MKISKDIEALFYKGQFKKLASSYSGKKIKTTEKATHLLIGALCMLGRGDEAELLFTNHSLSRREMIFSRFWLGVFYSRAGNFQKARLFFGQNLQSRSEKLNKAEQFYLFQGLGFYRFLKNRPQLALKYAEKAWELGFISGKPFMQILALDLRGQSLIQLQEVEQGLMYLRRAKSIADKLDDHGLSTALAVTIHTLGSQNQRIDIQQLLSFRSRLESEDAYSADLLNLEIAERYILNGQADRAEACLTHAKEAIFAKGNARHKALWQLRKEYLSSLRQEKKFDPFLQMKPDIYSYEKKRLLDSQFQDIVLKKFFLDKNLFSVFLPLMNGRAQKLVVDLLPDSLLLYARGNFIFHADALTTQLRGLLLLLLQGPQSREDIITKLYGYEYEAYRHDPMIYSLIHRLRQSLLPFSDWVEFSKNKYHFNRQVSVTFFEQRNLVDSDLHNAPLEVPMFVQKKEEHLNFRQLWAVHYTTKNGHIRPMDLVKEYQITSMTAFRDLQRLVEHKILKKKGSGRGTHYCLRPGSDKDVSDL